MGVVLLATAGPALGRRLSPGDELVIGREASGEWRLSDALTLSRRHARVARDASGRLTIEGPRSANRTFVNGERVRGRQVLAVANAVQSGSTTLQVTEVGSAPAPPSIRSRGPARPAPRTGDPASPTGSESLVGRRHR